MCFPEGDAGHGDLGLSNSVDIHLKLSSENIVDSFLVSENNAMEAEVTIKTTPRVSESDENKGAGENNAIITAPNEIVDSQASMSKSQSSVTSSRSKKKVFISQGSYNSYRRLLPYVTDLGIDDSPSFEIVEPTITKPSTIVHNTVASKEKDIDTVPSLDNIANAKSSDKGLTDVMQKSQEDAINDTLEECEQMTPPGFDVYSKPNIDKSSVKTSSNESSDSTSTSKLVLKSCSTMKMLQTPTSFSHRRLLPFLMSVSGDDSWASNGNQPMKTDNTLEQNQQPPTPALLNSDIDMDDAKLSNDTSQPITSDEKSDSPTSTLTPIEAPFDTAATSTPVSNDNLLDTNEPNTNCPESTSHVELF